MRRRHLLSVVTFAVAALIVSACGSSSDDEDLRTQVSVLQTQVATMAVAKSPKSPAASVAPDHDDSTTPTISPTPEAHDTSQPPFPTSSPSPVGTAAVTQPTPSPTTNGPCRGIVAGWENLGTKFAGTYEMTVLLDTGQTIIVKGEGHLWSCWKGLASGMPTVRSSILAGPFPNDSR